MRWQELKDVNGDDKRGNKTMMRKQDNHHISYKEKNNGLKGMEGDSRGEK